MLTLWLTLLTVGGAAQVAFAATVYYTSGTSGELCGGQRCVSPHATCQDGQCVCQSPYSEGIGTFHCYKPNNYFCAILNDPMIIGFDGSHTKAPLINAIPAAGVITSTCANSMPTGGRCDVQLGVFGRRHRGKTFVYGYMLYIEIDYFRGPFTAEMHGSTAASSGTYIYVYNSTSSSPSMTIAGHAPITTTFDEVNNFLHINLEACGVDIGIRGADLDGDPLVMPAGAYITVRTDCGPEPQFTFTELTACSPPPGRGQSLDEFTEQLSNVSHRNVSRHSAMVYRVLLAGGIPQDFQGSPSAELDDLVNALIQCRLSRVIDALEQCMFCLESPRFFRCYDSTPNGSDAILLMSECINAICNRDPTRCQNVKDTILDSNCAGGIQANQTTIMDNDCTF